jgi:hypothetical protein
MAVYSEKFINVMYGPNTELLDLNQMANVSTSFILVVKVAKLLSS